MARHRKPPTLTSIARRYGVKVCRDHEGIFDTTCAIHAAIAQAHADLAALKQLTDELDDAAVMAATDHDYLNAEITQIMPEFLKYLTDGRLAYAIKLYRRATGLGLYEAKVAVEQMAAVIRNTTHPDPNGDGSALQ